jgi:hypothetical protein
MDNWFAYVIAVAIFFIGVVVFGELLGWVVDRVSPKHPSRTRFTDEDAVEHRFYRPEDAEDY